VRHQVLLDLLRAALQGAREELWAEVEVTRLYAAALEDALGKLIAGQP
jgi:hypothetical protein